MESSFEIESALGHISDMMEILDLGGDRTPEEAQVFFRNKAIEWIGDTFWHIPLEHVKREGGCFVKPKTKFECEKRLMDLIGLMCSGGVITQAKYNFILRRAYEYGYGFDQQRIEEAINSFKSIAQSIGFLIEDKRGRKLNTDQSGCLVIIAIFIAVASMSFLF